MILGTLKLGTRVLDTIYGLFTNHEGKELYVHASDPFYIVNYYIKWVTTSWTHSIQKGGLIIIIKPFFDKIVFKLYKAWS